MLTTPLAFDCSANEMSSALLELPSFVANITVACRGPSLEGAYFWYFAIVSDVSMESTISPWECYGQSSAIVPLASVPPDKTQSGTVIEIADEIEAVEQCCDFLWSVCMVLVCVKDGLLCLLHQ